MSVLIGPYLGHLDRIRASQRTIEARGEFLRRSDDVLPYGVDQATGDELERWLYQPSYAQWTLHTYYTHLAGFYAWACNPIHLDDPLDWNPLQTVTRPETPKCIPHPVTDDQAQKAFASLTDSLLLASKLAAYEGLRCIEIARADREHVTQRNFRVPVGKGDRKGVVPTHPLIWKIVESMPPGPLLRMPDGERWDPKILRMRARYYLTRLLGEACGLHRFRHWFGTNVYRQTRDLVLTQQALRHSDPNSTIGYTLIADEERAEAISALPNLTLAAA